MYLTILLNLFTVAARFVLCEYMTVEDLKRSFGSQNCIKGSLSEFSIKSGDTLFLKEANDVTYIENRSSLKQSYETSALSKLHELAQYNDINYFFKLKTEEGPPHNKKFTVILTLGDEEFTGSGTSLKKAQHAVANTALQHTDYKQPPFKDVELNHDVLTPTVMLNNLGAKLALNVKYYLVDKEKEGILDTNYVIDQKLGKSYLQRLNESLYSNNDLHMRQDEPQTKGPFKVKVEVGDVSFYGISHTIQSARHEAASTAVDHLIKQIQEGNSACLREGSEQQCKEAKANIKSPISRVYEAAQLRNLDIEFEIIEESGPPHKKQFVTECRLAHLTTLGEGKSKKESKRAAAVNMLDRISELPEVSQEVQVRSILNNNKNSKKKKKKVLKTKFDEISMHVDNIVDSILHFGSSSQTDDLPSDHKKSKTSKNYKQLGMKKSYHDEILDVGNLLNIEVQFMDINDKGEYFTLLSLHINPQHICFGYGPSLNTARDTAAKGGLKLLQNIHFADYFENKKYTLVEGEIKERIQTLLNQDISETS